ncbi:MAG: ASPIC/UnbV domain-containing protein [Acidobacteriota bacterium]|nr:ASPIC/UnbV domain-containing protein [Acidobacteriota bacterium]
MSWNGYEHNVLLRNMGLDENGVPQYVDVAMALGADDIGDSRGVAAFDYDNDGDLDIAVNHNPGDHGVPTFPVVLQENTIGQKRNYLVVSLQGTRDNRDAVGAEVTVRSGSLNQVRLKSAGSAYAAQHDGRLYFGLGDATRVDLLTVRWPDGTEESFRNLDANTVVRIIQGEGMRLSSFPASPQLLGGFR